MGSGDEIGSAEVQPQFAILYLIRMREDFTDEHMAWCNGGRRRVYPVEDQHKYCGRIQNVYTALTVDPH